MTAQRRKRRTNPGESVVIRQLHAVELRLQARIDSSTQSMKDYSDSNTRSVKDYSDFNTQSMKDYIDSRISQVRVRLDNIDARFDKLDVKLDRSVTGFVEMIERGFGGHVHDHERIDDHERRIGALESTERRAVSGEH